MDNHLSLLQMKEEKNINTYKKQIQNTLFQNMAKYFYISRVYIPVYLKDACFQCR